MLAWMFCNAVLIAVVLKSGGLSRLSVRKPENEERRKTQVVEIYLKVVLWSVVSACFLTSGGGRTNACCRRHYQLSSLLAPCTSWLRILP